MTHVIREPVVNYRRPRKAPETLFGPEHAARFAARLLDGDGAREHLIALYLDARGRTCGYKVVSCMLPIV